MRAVSASGVQETAGLARQGGYAPPAFAQLTAAAQAFLMEETTKRQQIKPSKWMARLHLDEVDLKDWLTAMAWFAALNPPELRGRLNARGEWVQGDTTRPNWKLNDRQRVIVARSRCIGGPMSWHSISEFTFRHEISHVRCIELYESAIDRVHRVANGRHATLDEAPVDHMAAVREGNRAFKRGNIYGKRDSEGDREQARPEDGRPGAEASAEAAGGRGS
jgi:hypothetical protein